MKNMGNKWILVLSFGVIMSGLIGVSYNASIASIAKSSVGEIEKIPLYSVSTRGQLFGYTAEIVPGYNNEHIEILVN
jgi:hypothetical protein